MLRFLDLRPCLIKIELVIFYDQEVQLDLFVLYRVEICFFSPTSEVFIVLYIIKLWNLIIVALRNLHRSISMMRPLWGLEGGKEAPLLKVHPRTKIS